jgi:hypothetical protein
MGNNVTEHVKWTGIPETVNGDNVIGFTSSRRIGDLANIDTASLHSWYEKDPEKMHLGMLQMVQARDRVSYPLMEYLIKDAGRIKVDGPGGRFTYDLPVSKNYGVYTVADTGRDSERPGIGGGVFRLVLSRKFAPGDVLSYAPQSGRDVVVSAEYPVRQEGSGYVHYVKLNSQSEKDYFPADKLRAGIQYVKTGHLLGEFSTQFSGFEGVNPVTNMRCEFVLGNHRGVEGTATMYAGDRYLRNVKNGTVDFLEKAYEQIARWGRTPDGKELDTIVLGRATSTPEGRHALKLDTMKVMHAIEYFGFAELCKLENLQNMFQHGGLIEDNNSVLRANEGLWWQFMRGYTVGYSRPGSLGLSHIRQAVEYVHRNNKGMRLEDRWTRFKCGRMAYEDCLRLLQREFNIQLNAIGPLMGSDRALPKNPVSGDLRHLKLEMVRVGDLFLPGIGRVIIDHEPSLDQLPLDDISVKGFYGNDMPWTSYSMYIEDITSSSSSNAFAAVPTINSAKNILKPGTNVYYITPEQGSLRWGFETGRYDVRKTAEIISSNPKMAQTFFCHSISAAWIADLSRICAIHLEHAA